MAETEASRRAGTRASSAGPADPVKPAPPPPKPEPRRFVVEMARTNRPATAAPAIVEPPPVVATPVSPPQAGVQLPRIAEPTPAAPPATPPAPAAAPPKPQTPRLQLAGNWTLQPGAASTSPGLPESVAIVITENGGGIQGRLDARYKGNVSRVRLSFGGRTNGSARFPWTSPDGERGQIEFIRVPGATDRVEVVWYGRDSRQVFNHILRRLN
jgi:hypothetical protein